MISLLTRFAKLIMWSLVSVMVILAVAVTTLRVALPQLNHFQPQIIAWVNQGLGLNFETAQIYGSWRNTRPSLSFWGKSSNA